jgi:hypothetical protein
MLAVPTRPFLLVALRGAASTQQTRTRKLLHAHREAHVDLARLHGHDRRAQGGGAGGARVGHVVHGDAGLTDLLLQLLTDTRVRLHQTACGQDAHLLHGDPAVAQGAHRGLGRQVDRVLVGMLAELGHRDAKDPDVVAHGVLLFQFAGSKPKPMASTPASSAPRT